ncbi:major capsid protein [Rodentibacter caecimuris]|uniref:major capsid protein n=1 Tax=Rodentibacter caecimuris TaxID=1796644 RepID=UPI002586DB86|nr:major capsid protein [Rodentibacter heylii]
MSFDLQVFNKQTQLALTETVDQDIDKFNKASGGTIVLQNAPVEGDFDIRASFKAVAGLVRRRNAYGQGTVEAKRLEQLLNVAVKVAAGTPPLEYEPQQYHWILKNPELAAITIGQQLAKARLADMLNTAVLGGVAAIGGNAKTVLDDKTQSPTFRTLNKGAALFGDRSGSLKAWVMHSTTLHTLFENALTNTERLFNYDNINVVRDPFGRVFVVTDSPALVNADGSYNTLGLVENAILVGGNNDFNSVILPKVGGENIGATYQAEWTYNLGILGYKWDMTAGGKSPNDTALGTSTNWKKSATFDKDTAGVLVKTK